MKDSVRLLVCAAICTFLVVGCSESPTQPLGFPSALSLAATFTPHTSSQNVACNLVDQAIAGIPHGDGYPVTAEETGPGGWRFSGSGGSFVTFSYELNDNGTAGDPSDDFYDVVAGRSNIGSNAGTFNDYPEFLDLPQDPSDEVLMFGGRRGEIVLTGDGENDPPLFALPGQGGGEIRITVTDADGDGDYEGCAKSPLLKNFGFTIPEGGDFVQREYFKAYAEVDANGVVTSYEWTEISTFNNTVPLQY